MPAAFKESRRAERALDFSEHLGLVNLTVKPEQNQ
jgi:hypothetical protein